MDVEKNALLDDALNLIYERNAFYRKKYHVVLGIYALAVICIVMLASIVIYLIRYPTQPVYFPADSVGHLIQAVPLQTPNMSEADVVNYVTQAVQSAYSYDYLNYRQQLQSAQKYFTDYGWRNYMNGLQASGNLLALTTNKYVVLAQVVSTPKLVREGILSGVLAWKFQVPVLVTYMQPPYDNQPNKSVFQNPLEVTVIVERQNLLQSYNGLGIIQMNASMVLSSPTQNVALPTS